MKLKNNSFYIAKVSFHPRNPVHIAILFSSFLENGNLTDRAEIIYGNDNKKNYLKNVYYLDILQEIEMEKLDENQSTPSMEGLKNQFYLKGRPIKTLEWINED